MALAVVRALASTEAVLSLDIPRAGWEPELLRALDRGAQLTPL